METAFEVKQVIERPSIGQAGKLQQVTVIYLETFRGNTGQVEMPTKEYLALTATDEGKQIIKAVLQEKADSLDAAFAL